MTTRCAGALALLALCGVPTPARGSQAAGAPQAIFGAGVDLLAVDVSVVDADGRPLPGLAPEVFKVTIDGRPRRVISADFVSLDPDREPAAAPLHYSTNEGLRRGRLVLFAVDQAHVRAGTGRMVAQAAGRLLERLTPADRVALVSFPAPGPTVDFTSDFNKLREGLARIVGRGRFGERLSLADVLAYGERGTRWDDALRRECAGSFNLACRVQLETEAASLAHDLQRHALVTRRALGALFDSLGQISGPKTVVLVSEGLLMPAPHDHETLARQAAAAQVTLFALQLDSQAGAEGAGVGDEAEDHLVHNTGLQTLAHLTRGSLFRVSGGGGGAFERMARELSGYYLLGLEPEPSDRDGRDHAMEVSVARPHARVRARRSARFEVAPAGPRAEAALRAALGAPLPAVELPLRVASYALRDAGTGQVRVLVNAEIGHGAGPLGRVQVAYSLLDSRGRTVAGGVRAVPDPGPGTADGWPYLAALVLQPGLYTLRFAAIDGRGRRGSLVHPLQAQLNAGDGFELSDLMLGVPPVPPAAELRPRVHLRALDEGAAGYVELYGREEHRLAQARVSFELARSAEGPAVQSVPGRLSSPEGGRLSALAVFETRALEPGEYVVRATVSQAGRVVGSVSRPLAVLAPRPEHVAPSPAP